MAQMTESLARSLLGHAERGEHPPITAWETCQLLRFWLAQHERYAHHAPGYAQLGELPRVAIDQDYVAANVAACASLAEQAKRYGDAVGEFQLSRRLRELSGL